MKLLRLLPSKIRHQFIRNRITLPLSIPANFKFKVAETQEELEASFRLVYQAYLPLGYCRENDFRMRATIYHALSSTTTLIATDNGQVVGTLTVVRDNQLNLPLERAFNVYSLREKSGRVAEITSLVIDKKYRRKAGGAILFPLLKLMYEYTTQYFGVSHLVVAVHPKEVDFYKGVLCFEEIPNSMIISYLGAPAVALFLNLPEALFAFKMTYSQSQPNKNLFRFFVEHKLENVTLPLRQYNKINDPVITPEFFEQLFVEKLRLLEEFNANDRKRIYSYLKHFHNLRSQTRIEAEVRAEIWYKKQILAKTSIAKDVSKHGLRIFCKESIPIHPNLEIRINVSANSVAILLARPIWMSSDRGIGFEIVSFDKAWQDYITFLHNDLKLAA